MYVSVYALIDGWMDGWTYASELVYYLIIHTTYGL